MRISTQTDIIFPAFGIDEGMKIFKEAGFDALDFSMFYMNSSFESVLGNMSEDELVGKLLESRNIRSRSIRLTRRSRATDSATRNTINSSIKN